MVDTLNEQAAIEAEAGQEEITAIPDGMLLDYINGKPVKDNSKEQVRQRIARALFHEYGISVEDMEPDFRMPVGGKNKKAGIAIFRHGQEHKVENLRRVVVCEKEPTGRGITKMRSHDQAKRDLEALKELMAAAENCEWGLWTNGLEFFFLQKEVTRFDVSFKPVGDWPMGDETLGTRDVASIARLRVANEKAPELLKVTFRRCHNFIHGNEGMPKDKAFKQLLYLIFAKMYDEQNLNGQPPRFWAGPTEQFTPEGQTAISERIKPIFEEVKQKYPLQKVKRDDCDPEKGDDLESEEIGFFSDSDKIEITDRALAFLVSELSKYDFSRSDIDVKGAAYQEIVGDNLRGDRGQYFTPKGVVKLAVAMLDPQPNERALDPACGTGGFLIATINHMLSRFRRDKNIKTFDESTAEFLSMKEELKCYVETYLFGADFDNELVKASKMNLMMSANAYGNVFHMDSLMFPDGHLTGNKVAEKKIKLGSIDVLMTNPPFGSDIPISDPMVLNNFDLAGKWGKRQGDGSFIRGDGYQTAVAPEILFIERCVNWLRPGGRMGIVLPDGILGNPGDEPIRRWILKHCWVLASVDLPVEVFIVEANVNILTSLLFLKKKTDQEMKAEALGQVTDYPVFMAVAEKVGFDRRGNTLYKRSPDGEDLVETVIETETIRLSGEKVKRTLRRKQKIVDDDLLEIAKEYQKFRSQNPEPGLPTRKVAP
ncbi:methylation-associated defense system DNA methyltransferase MAD2 [Nodosilinea sp. PGN35]|uniref:methylation-associated defense system DNA methyltransferase MAD2 n=1 Tax=Nodosilinea sp. PGN35 TaxID=3020489 RepID=UPI00398AE6DC